MVHNYYENLKIFLASSIPLILIIGSSLLVLNLVNLIMPNILSIRSVRIRGISAPSKGKDLPGWSRHLVLLSKSVSKKSDSDDMHLQNFIIRSIVFLFIAYIVFGYYTGVFTNFTFSALFNKWLIAVSLMSGSIPYVFMRIRLHKVRVKNSYELVPAVNLLLLKYANHNGNLYYPVLETSKELKGDIQLAFMGLIPVLQGSKNITIEQAIELFIYRIKTNWAIQLGILIHKSEEHGDNIEQGLQWLVTDMSEVAKITEEIKVENRETVQLGYFPLVLLPAVIWLNQYPSQGKSWYYYFHHPTGIKVLIFTILVCIICALVAYIVQRPRNEV